MQPKARQYLWKLELNKWYRFDNIPEVISEDVIKAMDENFAGSKYRWVWDEFGERFAKVRKYDKQFGINY